MGDDALIGRMLGSYRIDRLLGRGGMARVYYGWDANLDRPAAVKIIDTLEQSDPAYAKRIVQEAKAIARWRHENIVQVYHAASEDGLYYFAMEYIEGRDLGHYLAQYVSEGELIPTEDLLRIGWAIARALDYAHQHKVIHRDVKPANVLLADDGRIVLADFGLALDVQQGTMGEVFGSPHYISPEQAVTSSNAVPQSDLYSFAIILYEMLVGRVPFDDPSPISLAIKHISEALPLPTVLNSTVSIATEAVLLKALSKEPQDRFQSGEALMTAVEQSLIQAPAAEPEPTREVSHVTIAERIAENAAIQEAAIAARRQQHSPASVPAQTAARRKPAIALPVLLIVGALGCVFLVAVAALFASMSGGGEQGSVPTITLAATVDPGVAAIKGEVSPTPLAPTETLALPTETLQSSPVSEVIAPTFTSPPTETLIPTIPATETPVPAPTVLYPNGYRMVLYYTATGFYLKNPGDLRISVRSFSFEALDSAGVPTTYQFSGNQWAQLYPEVWPGNCDSLEVLDHVGESRPADCVTFNATRTPPEGSSSIFWIPREGVTQFRVLWNDQEVARCEISLGVCEIRVMLPAQ